MFIKTAVDFRFGFTQCNECEEILNNRSDREMFENTVGNPTLFMIQISSNCIFMTLTPTDTNDINTCGNGMFSVTNKLAASYH